MMSFISACLDILFPPSEESLIVRGLTKEVLHTCYRPVKITKTIPETTSLLDYADERVKALIHCAKFSKNKKAWICLGDIFSLFIQDEKFPENALIIPIPLHKKRYRARGYNQVLEVLKKAKLPPHVQVRSDILRKKYALESQVDKSREERHNLPKDLFYIENLERKELDTLTVFIVDDVVTTGTTLARAINTFREAGIKDIRPVAFSYKR